MTDARAFEKALARVAQREIAGCVGLVRYTRLSAGASQQTYRLELAIEKDGKKSTKTLAFRRATAGIADETRTLGPDIEARLFAVAQNARVPAPHIYYVLSPHDNLGEGFLMEWLEGETLGGKIARAPEFAKARETLAYACGEMLGRIHMIDVGANGLDKLLQTATPEALVRHNMRLYEELKTPQPMIDFTARWLLDNVPPQLHALGLVHGDFRNGNLMVDKTRGLVAVLDWELAHIGDAVRDLGWICTNSWRFGVGDLPVGGFGTRADLLAGYTASTGREVAPAHLKFWEVFGSFWWAVGTLGMGASYMQGLDRSPERPAIGRRSSECQMDCANLLIAGGLEAFEPIAPDASALIPTEELLSSARDFLRDDVVGATKGRTRFLARVVANSVDIALREQQLGAVRADYEQTHLPKLLGGQQGTRTELLWGLVTRLRDGTMSLDNTELHEFLRNSVALQLCIDQPNYWGLPKN